MNYLIKGEFKKILNIFEKKNDALRKIIQKVLF